MKKIMTCLLACATVLCTGVSAKGKKCEARKAKHVVLIGADGFASAVVREHPGAFPNLERLMREGSYTLERRSVLPSSSALNWASMMMGASPEIHGYTTWNSRTPELPSRVIGKYSIFPGICGLIRDSYPEAEIDCGFTWEDHLRLYHALAGMKGKFLLSYNDCPEIRELYKEYNFFDFKRVHSMAQKYEAGKEFPELLIANYDLFERERQQPHQLTLFDSIDKPLDYEKILKENIVCRIKR